MDFSNYIAQIFIVTFSVIFIFEIILKIINFKYLNSYKRKVPDFIMKFTDNENIIRMKNYFNEKFYFSLFKSIIDSGMIILILILSVIPVFYGFLTNFVTNQYLLSYLFFGCYFLLGYTVSLPFDIFYHFKIEKKYEFNKMTIKTWVADQIKSALLIIIFSVIIISFLIFFISFFENIWWILLWGFFIIFQLLLQIIYPTFIAPLFNKFTPLSDEKLSSEIEKLLSSAGFKSSGVYEMDASKRSGHSNAYFTGIGKSKKIVLFDTLMQKLDNNEILAVLSHEIGHFKKKHIIFNLIFSSITLFVVLFVAHFFLNNSYFYNAFGLSENVKFIGLFLFFIFISPLSFIFNPVTQLISQKHEKEADNFAYKLTTDKDSLKSALIKLNIENLSNLFPAPIYTWFYYSHPPLLKRLSMIDEIKNTNQSLDD